MSELDGLELRHIHYFLAVARAGTISGAATELRIAQPSLSQQIAKLERRIGVQLFRRTPRGVELTEQGEAFRPGAEKMLQQLRDSVAAARGVGQDLVVGVCSGVPADLLVDVEKALIEAAAALPGSLPVGAVELRTRSTGQQVLQVQQGELTFGLLRMPFEATGLHAVPVVDVELGVVLGEHHPLASRTELSWDDLQGQRLLWFDRGRAPGFARAVLEQIHAHGWEPELLETDVERQALFAYELRRDDAIVALRPRSAVLDQPHLLWLPIAGGRGPRERLALAARAGTRNARLLDSAVEILSARKM